ncbi:MAG TPA: 50S ribosomal protein L10 [Clostridiales bacterium]|jgi:large subunit ribosomal protein L10|nr:50S ribosomal protein L10 [Clostridiales bacterium]
MPSAKILAEKQAQVAKLSDQVKTAASGVLVNYAKTTVEDDTVLRRELRSAGVEYGVYKNSILRFVFNETGLSDMIDKLVGMSALAICQEDQIAPARILAKFAESHPSFEIKGGFFEGSVIPVEKVIALSKLPSKETLIAQLMSVLNGSMQSLACVLQAVVDKAAEAPAE